MTKLDLSIAYYVLVAIICLAFHYAFWSGLWTPR